MRLEHANITVLDIDRSAEFYRAVFGFEERWRGMAASEDGTPIKAVHVGTPDLYLSFFEAQSSGGGKPDYSVTGLNHIGFVVDELESYRSKLAALGIKIHFEPNYEPGRRIYFFDPDGIEIELVAYIGVNNE